MVNDEELLVVAFDIQLRYGFESAWECLMLIVFFLECGANKMIFFHTGKIFAAKLFE